MPVPNIPENYLCPITVQVMFDPVIAEDGCTYEREAIERWFNEGHNTSPMGHGIIGNRLIPNRDKRAEIMQFLDGHATFIHEAIDTSTPERNNLEFINALIKRNSSNLNRRQENTGNTPLHIAVMHNKINVTQLLLQAGADCKVRNNQHQTPKKVAKELEFWEIVELIDNYHLRSNQMTSGTDDLRRSMDMLQQENRQLDAEITRLTAQMQRLNVNQQHNERPNFSRFFSRQAMELLALGVIGLGAAVKYQRSTTRKLNEQQLAIDTCDNTLKQMLTWKDIMGSRLTSISDSLQHASLCLHNNLITAVAYGEQEKAENMIRQNPDLLLVAGDVIDCAGRQFKQITAFQYALWALDWNMWEMLRKYMPEDAIREQIEGFDNGSWIKEHGSQASWQNLIDALKQHIDNYNNVNERQNNWCKKVRAAQLMLPAHVINEYSRPDQDLCPTPNFKKLKLPRTGVDTWHLSDEGIGGFRSGSNYAWTRSASIEYEWGYGGVLRRVPSVSTVPANCEMVTLIELLKIRNEQKAQVISEFMAEPKTRPKL